MNKIAAQKISQALQKSAAYIAELEAENRELKSVLSNYQIKESAGDTLTKISEVSGLEVDKTISILRSMSPEQRQLLEKISNTNFRLGGSSDEEIEKLSAEDEFLEFMRR